MTAEIALNTEERLRQLLHHLGIDQAHFAGWLPRDWTGLAAKYPGVFSSLTVIGGFDSQTVEHLAAKLAAVTGDQGPIAEAMRVP